MSLFRLMAAFATIGMLVSGCSVHPIPDDVSRYSTFDIVRNIRCEAKETVAARIGRALKDYPALSDIDPNLIREPDNAKRIAEIAPGLAATFDNYSNGSIAYNFEFVITENNTKGGSLSFLKPFLTSAGVSLNADGNISKTRVGERRFNMVETFYDLSKLECGEYVRPDRNKMYPLTGSIGMEKIMTTFIDLSELGGGQEKFIDTITFTTSVRGGVNASIELAPVTDKFKLTRASANFRNSRTDVHKLIVSLAFPEKDLRQIGADEARRESKRKALVDLCIARAEQREDNANTLRFVPAELSCRRQYGPRGTIRLPY